MANFKVTMFFGKTKWGFTETWYWTAGVGDVKTCESDVGKLVVLRRFLTDKSLNVEAARITGCDEQGRPIQGVTPREIRYEGVNAGAGAQVQDVLSCNSPWLALYVRFYNRERTAARNLLIRGIPDSQTCIQRDGYGGPRSLVPPLVSQAISDYADFLSGGGLSGLQSTGKFGFVSLQQDQTRGKLVAIDDMNADPVSGTVSIKPAAPAALTKGQRIHLHAVGPGTKGVSGDVRIVGAVGTVAPFVGFYATSKVLTEPTCLSYVSGAVYWPIVKGITRPALVEIGRVVRKMTGAPYFGTSGKPSKNKQKKKR
jgi:hypothetical protein